jgi:hypothetical protein
MISLHHTNQVVIITVFVDLHNYFFFQSCACVKFPFWYLYFVTLVGLVSLNEPDSHAGGNICYQ